MKYIFEKKKSAFALIINIVLMVNCFIAIIANVVNAFVKLADLIEWRAGLIYWWQLIFDLVLFAFILCSTVSGVKKKDVKPTAFIVSTLHLSLEMLAGTSSMLESLINYWSIDILVVFLLFLLISLLILLTAVFVFLLENKKKKVFKILSIVFCAILSVIMLVLDIAFIVLLIDQGLEISLGIVLNSMPINVLVSLLMTINICISYKFKRIAPKKPKHQPAPVQNAVAQPVAVQYQQVPVVRYQQVQVVQYQQVPVIEYQQVPVIQYQQTPSAQQQQAQDEILT